MEAIKTTALAYRKGSFFLRDLNFKVEEGGVYGLIGLPGSGKTAIIRLMNGLLRPEGGECRILGLSPYENPEKVHASCGVMTGSAGVYGHLSGMQNLVFFGQVFGMKQEEAFQRANELMKDLDIWEMRDIPAHSLPTGVLRRLDLARALVHRPRVLFLDEPSRELDPESAAAVNEIVASVSRDSGTTVFLCAKEFGFAQAVCGRYGLLNNGRIGLEGTLEELSAQMRCPVKARFRLKEGELKGFQQEDGWWQAELSSQEEMPALLQTVLEQGRTIYEARLIRPTLRDVFQAFLAREEEVQE